MRKEEKKINDKGFSLVELIVVIAIMVALVAVVAVAVTRYVGQSRAAADVSNANNIKSAIQVEITDPSSGINITSTSGSYIQVPSGMDTLKSMPVVESKDYVGGTWEYLYDGTNVQVQMHSGSKQTGDLTDPSNAAAFKKLGGH